MARNTAAKIQDNYYSTKTYNNCLLHQAAL